ncbi:MAG: hypothetical protein OXE93_01230, partial [bacterium]|nr:hypothetical protein [bacterium]
WQVTQNNDGRYDLRPPPTPHSANKTPLGEHRKHQLRPPPKPHTANRTPQDKHGNHQLRPTAKQQVVLLN